MKKIYFIEILLASLAVMSAGMVACGANGLGQLRLYTGDNYIGLHPDAWLSESWVMNSTTFNLTVENHSPQEDCAKICLIIAVYPNPSSVDVKVNGNLIGGYVFDTPAYTRFGKHGVYPAWYAEWCDVGPLKSGESLKLNVQVIPKDGAKVHFDAVGFDQDGNYIMKNAFSEDVTFVPEIALGTLLPTLTAFGVYWFYRLRKKR